jgi:HipA-like protein
MEKNKNFKHITKLSIINYSGFNPKFSKIEIAKKHSYCVIKDVSVTGDAPKDIIRLYEYGHSLKRKHKKWPIYIAKLGHKYYPLESITEQLISDIGLYYGFIMASSKICLLGGQIRFLSRYFIDKETDELHHGADLYAGYLNDKEFVDEVEIKRMTQSFFTIKFTQEVIQHFFKDSHNEIFTSFMHMLFFDALVGNNDRHMYNWGVIRDIYGNNMAKYSPIYDSARGLLWNIKESKIIELVSDGNRLKDFVKKYCNNSNPKIGIEDIKKVNHFELIESYKGFYFKDEFIKNLFENNKIELVVKKINKDYRTLYSKERRYIISEILKFRYSKLKEIVNL